MLFVIVSATRFTIYLINMFGFSCLASSGSMCPLSGGGWYSVFVKYVVVFFLGTFIGAYIAKILWAPTVAHGHCPFVAPTPSAPLPPPPPPPAPGSNPSAETENSENIDVDADVADADADADDAERSAVFSNDPIEETTQSTDPQGGDDDDVTAVISPPP